MIRTPESLDEIARADEAHLYPRQVLAGCETALVLFCAAFFGRQDAVWVAAAGLRATCLDTDADRLDEMAELYPTDWDFLEADVYEWAPLAATDAKHWDVVSIDCPTGHFERCAELLPLWCALARKSVVLGCGLKRKRMVVPDGWRLSEYRKRSTYDGGVWWAVLEAA